MRLEHIHISGEGEVLSKLARAISDLPEETIKGVSQSSYVTAFMHPDGTAQIGDLDPMAQRVSMSVPEGSEEVEYSEKRVSFKWKGQKYLFVEI